MVHALTRSTFFVKISHLAINKHLNNLLIHSHEKFNALARICDYHYCKNELRVNRNLVLEDESDSYDRRGINLSFQEILFLRCGASNVNVD